VRPGSQEDLLLVLSEVTVRDVSVVHPAAATYVACVAGSTATVWARVKTHRYHTDDPYVCAFTPPSTETFGLLGTPALQLLTALATTAVGNGWLSGMLCGSWVLRCAGEMP
jgi:hypothetical protein